MSEIDAAVTTWINAWAGRLPFVDFIMIWISAVGVPFLVLAVAVQWWFPRSDRSTRHVLWRRDVRSSLASGLIS